MLDNMRKKGYKYRGKSRRKAFTTNTQWKDCHISSTKKGYNDGKKSWQFWSKSWITKV